eukprot:746017-Hanusia_phi.AAC.1
MSKDFLLPQAVIFRPASPNRSTVRPHGPARPRHCGSHCGHDHHGMAPRQWHDDLRLHLLTLPSLRVPGSVSAASH